MDVAFMNALANRPDVRPYVGGGSGVLDLRGLVEDARNYCYRYGSGATVFVALDPGRYELHTMVPAEERGQAVMAFAQEAFRYMFTTTDCTEIVTKVPASNQAADLAARRVGFSASYRRPAAWEDGSAVTYYALTLDEWRAIDELALSEGQAFHTLLEAAKIRAGSEMPVHPDDDAHDRAAGLAMLMARAGNYRKAVWSYSRWARFAGYESIELVSETPPVIDVRDALVTVQGGLVEVLSCR